MASPDRYHNWDRIGAGAHAIVYRCYDSKLECDVAIKLLNEQAHKHEALVVGMQQEVLISRRLRHKYICPIHDIYEGERGLGIVMDVIDGQDLKDWIEEQKSQFLVTVQDRLDLLKRMCDALNMAHQHIVHRDLKPSNIFLRGNNIAEPVIMDFGISVLGTSGNTEICGTPRYMAPEQYLAPEDVDRRADLFALGIMAYELFTGRTPPTSLRLVFKTGVPPRIPLEKIDPPSNFCPAVPPALDNLILLLMSYDAQDRPNSASEVLDTLRQIELRATDFRPARVSDIEREKVRVGGGEYFMGSPPTSSNSNEIPARRIVLDEFEIDAYPVTNKEYREFTKSSGNPDAPLSDDPVFGRDDLPVVGLTYEEAEKFARWMGGELPTEAQWECAARAGEKFAEYPWGNDEPNASYANIGSVHNCTTPVAAHPAGRNSIGIWDMCGNVWEWCRDLYDPKFYSSIRPGMSNPVSEKGDNGRSIRGGSFQSFLRMGRCAFRGSANVDDRRNDLGFRVVYELGDK